MEIFFLSVATKNLGVKSVFALGNKLSGAERRVRSMFKGEVKGVSGAMIYGNRSLIGRLRDELAWNDCNLTIEEFAEICKKLGWFVGEGVSLSEICRVFNQVRTAELKNALKVVELRRAGKNEEAEESLRWNSKVGIFGRIRQEDLDAYTAEFAKQDAEAAAKQAQPEPTNCADKATPRASWKAVIFLAVFGLVSWALPASAQDSQPSEFSGWWAETPPFGGVRRYVSDNDTLWGFDVLRKGKRPIGAWEHAEARRIWQRRDNPHRGELPPLATPPDENIGLLPILLLALAAFIPTYFIYKTSFPP